MTEIDIIKDELNAELLKLKQEHSFLKKKYDMLTQERNEIEESYKKQNDILMKLNDFSLESAYIPYQDVFPLIVNKLREIFNVKAAWITSYDETSSDLIVEYSSLSIEDNAKIVKLLGNKLLKMRTHVDEKQYKRLTSEIVGYINSINELTFGAIPDIIGKTIERLLNIGWFVGLALVYKGKLVGTLIVVGDKEFYPPRREEIAAFGGIASNALGRKKAEESLQEKEQNYRYIFDLSTDALLIQDIETRKIIDVNRTMVELYGYESKAETLHCSIEDLSAVDEGYNINKIIEYDSLAVSQGYITFEWLAKKKNGDKFWVEVTLRLVHLGGKERILSNVRDISEKKHAQSEIMLLASIFERSNDFIGIADTDQKAIYVNRAGQTMLGLEGDEVVKNTKIEDYFFPEDLPYVKNNILPVLFDQGRWYGEFRFRHFKTGEPVEVMYDLFLTEDPATKKIINISTISRDISERKKVEKELKQSRERLDSIFRVAPTGIGVLKNRIISEVNLRICEMTGYTKEELIGQSARIIYPSQEEYEFVGTEKYRQINVKGTGTVETKWLKKDGTVIDVLLASTPIDANNQSIGVTFTALDISERKRMELTLKEGEEKYRSIYEGAAIGIFHSTFEGRFIDVNPMMAKMFGFDSPQDLVDSITSISEQLYVTPPKRDEIIADLLAKGETVRIENRYKRKDGSEWDAYLHLRYVIGDDGKPSFLEGFVEDITDRKQIETSLKESEEKYRTLVTNAMEGIVILDMEGTILFANQAAERIFKIQDTNAILNKKVFDFIAPASIPKVIEDFSNVMNGKDSYLSEYCCYNAIGEEIWVESIGKVILYEGKQADLVSLRDITDRKHSEEALKRSEEKYKELFDTMPNGFYRSTPDGYFVDANPALIQMLGYESLEELKKLYIPRDLFIHETERNEIVKENTEFINQLETYRIKTKDGRVIWVEDNARYIKDQSGNIIFNEGICKDITERKRNEELLRESEEKYRTLINTMSEGLMRVDNNDKILFVNDRLCRMFGYEKEELIGKIGYETIIYEPDRYIIKNKNEDRLSDLADKYEIRGKRKSGETFWLSVSGSAIKDTSGQIIGSIGLLIDITERKMVEETLRESERILRETNASKDKFFSIIAHDLRSPVSNFLGLSDILSKDMNSMSIKDLQEISEAIHNSANSVFNLLNDLLQWSRTQTGSIKLKIEEIELNEMGSTTITLLKPIADNKLISLTNKIPKNTITHCDSNMITTVFRNLVSNAIKFTPEGGSVEIGIDTLVNNNYNTQTMHTIYVKDNGVGMEKVTIDKLFNISETLTTPGTANEKGTGLGLILCKEFVEKHGGKIWVESEIGKGSTFYFTLPS